MLTVYAAAQGGLRTLDLATGQPLPAEVVWIDLLNPTPQEDQAAEQALGIAIPTREEMQEIEISSRLYKENGGVYMTATVLAGTDTDRPQATPVTFILAGERLVTVRYAEPTPFRAVVLRGQRLASGYASGEAVLLALLEAIIDRAADILERVGAEVEGLSQEVFQRSGAQAAGGRDFQAVLRHLGRQGELASKVRESLVSINRLLSFLTQQRESSGKAGKEFRARIKTMTRDVQSLTDHVSFQSGKIGFLLDATLGLINIEQNATIKIFSVVAVVFLPPTLIASIYGMNFDFMPELHWTFGYPMALAMMVASAVLPYVYFKRRGWL
ncbi:MAG: magnesium/cobalt transporter CorA [Pseudomonadota bacterium]|nr:magnesium/cobalt transporter CorA [Pseudomonadota bacterium]